MTGIKTQSLTLNGQLITSTGSNLYVNGGPILAGGNQVVYTTGSQFVSGLKTFFSGAFSGGVLINGQLITADENNLYLNGSGVGQGGEANLANVVYTTGSQMIHGKKYFQSGIFSGAVTISKTPLIPTDVSGCLTIFQTSSYEPAVTMELNGSKAYISMGVNQVSFMDAAYNDATYRTAITILKGNVSTKGKIVFTSPYQGNQYYSLISGPYFGVGATSPVYEDAFGGINLGVIYVNGSTGSCFAAAYNESRKGHLQAEQNALSLNTVGGLPLIFRTSGVQRAIIDSTGTFTISGQAYARNVTLGLSGNQPLLGAGSTSTLRLDFNGAGIQDISVTGSTLISGINYGVGRQVTARLFATTASQLEWANGWRFVNGTAPTGLSPNKLALLKLISFSTVDSGIAAEYLVES